jgi:hypothetical protein
MVKLSLCLRGKANGKLSLCLRGKCNNSKVISVSEENIMVKLPMCLRGKGKVKLFTCLIKHHSMKTYRRMKVHLHPS